MTNITINGALTAALQGETSLEVEFFVEVWQSQVKVAEVEVLSGSISQSYNVSTRRTCDLELAGWSYLGGGEGIIPEIVYSGTDTKYGDDTYGEGIYGDAAFAYYRSLLAPLISQARVYGIYRYPGGSDTIKLGTFTLGDPTFSDTPAGVTISVSGWSGEYDISRNLFEAPVAFAAGTPVDEAMHFLVDPRVVQGSSVTFPDTNETTSKQSYLPGEGVSAWAVARELAATVGWVVYVDRDGNVVGEPTYSASEYPEPSWSLSDTGTLLELTLSPWSSDFCNRMVVSAENSDQSPVFAVATDVTGPYGTTALGMAIAKEYRSDKPSNLAQAQNLANTMLRKYGRMSETVSGTCLPIPHLEVGSTVLVTSTGLQLDDPVYVLERITTPLDPTEPTTFEAVRRIG